MNTTTQDWGALFTKERPDYDKRHRYILLPIFEFISSTKAHKERLVCRFPNPQKASSFCYETVGAFFDNREKIIEDRLVHKNTYLLWDRASKMGSAQGAFVFFCEPKSLIATDDGSPSFIAHVQQSKTTYKRFLCSDENHLIVISPTTERVLFASRKARNTLNLPENPELPSDKWKEPSRVTMLDLDRLGAALNARAKNTPNNG